MIRKITVSLLCFLMLLGFNGSFNQVKADDDNFDTSVCYRDLSKADAETKKACRAYQDNMSATAAQLSGKLDDIKGQISDLKKDIKKHVTKIAEYQAEIEEKEAEVGNKQNQIDQMTANIGSLLVEIETRENHIAEIDSNIQDRMVALQSFMHINNYIDFLVGASSFMDLIRRVEALNDIQAYDNYMMNLLNEEIQALDADRIELERQKELVEAEKQKLIAEEEYVKGLKEVAEELLAEYYKQKAELEAEEAKLADNLDEVNAALNSVSSALNEIAASAGWTKPISGASLSAGTWHYPSSFGGGVHLGIDIAVAGGTSVKAVANGYVLYSANSCNTVGYLGSSCGYPGTSGGGNQVYLLVSVGGKTYAVKYLHLQKDSPIAMGSIVSAGDVIGKVGRSGNASGYHSHIEIFYLGTQSITYYASHWNGDFAFGCHWGSAALKYTCDATGGAAPCRLAPAGVLGY